MNNNKDYKYIIRAHHGMCMCFFRGKGYSKNFVENMEKIIKDLNENPLLNVKIVNETEDICDKCPNNKNKKCESYEKVLSYDNKVLEYCALKPGTIMSFSEFRKLVKSRILDENRREIICGNCQWTDLCH